MRKKNVFKLFIIGNLLVLYGFLIYASVIAPPSSEETDSTTVYLKTEAPEGMSSPPAIPSTTGEQALSIVRILPSGSDITPSRQVVITFNKRVAPLGDMNRKIEDIPITITPALDCSWRWIDPSNLGCNLSDDASMAPATKYRITVGPGIYTREGETISRIYEHEFTTTLPKVSHTRFFQWQGLDMPVFYISFNQKIEPKGLESFFHFSDDTNGKKVAVSISKADNHGYSFYIRPQEKFAHDAEITLWAKEGIASLEGPEKSDTPSSYLYSFATFPTPEFLGFACAEEKTEGKEPSCSPFTAVRALFSTPVEYGEVKNKVVFSPEIIFPDENVRTLSHLSEDGIVIYDYPHTKGRAYSVPLPFLLKASTQYTAASSESLKDIFGRDIPAFKGSFSILPRNPEYRILYTSSVLEQGEDTDVPIVTTNIKEASISLARLTAGGTLEKKMFRQFSTPDDIAVMQPFGMRKLLDDESGIISGEIETFPTTYKRKFYGIVTPWNLTVKLGHYTSLVWVTDMATGNPVAGVKVSIDRDDLTKIGNSPKKLAESVTGKDGTAFIKKGIADLSPELEYIYKNSFDKDGLLFVKASDGENMAVMPLSYDFKVDNYIDVPYSLQRKFGHIRAWAVTPQGIYKPGETVEFKLFVRQNTNETLGKINDNARMDIYVSDPMGRNIYLQEKIKLSDKGSFAGKFDIQKAGMTGWHTMYLNVSTGNEERIYYPLRFLVTDFNPAEFKVFSQPSLKKASPGDKLEIATSASLMAGGPYAQAPLRVNASFKARPFSSEDNIAQHYYFAGCPNYSCPSQVIYEKNSTLNDSGTAMDEIAIGDYGAPYGTITVESSVKDDRGKNMASSSYITYFSVDRFIGLRNTSWSYEAGKEVKVGFLITDVDGFPVKGIEVKGLFEHEEKTVTRVKGSGNVYEKRYDSKWMEAGTCQVVSLKEGGFCSFFPAKAGHYRFTMTAKDSKEKETSNTIDLWVAGADYVLWDDGGRNDFLPISPEKKSYSIGDIARYRVHNPYPGAYALITVERYGILDSFVKKLKNSVEIIEVPIKPDYMPGFYLSVSIFSPRVEKAPTALENQKTGSSEPLLDLGKPAMKSGYIRVPVKDPYKEVEVSVKTDNTKYRPKEKVKVSAKASVRNKNKEEPLEMIAIVLDEGVLALLSGGRKNFDIYSSMYSLEDLDLINYNTILKLIGKQKIESKGGTQGGDGGYDDRYESLTEGIMSGIDLRDNFKHVAYYNPSLKVNSKGETEFEFEAPDNLTKWRIFVIAATPTDRFGMGDGYFVVDKDIELRKLSPNQLLEGDGASLGVTVINRTDSEKQLELGLTAAGDIKGSPAVSKNITLGPFKRQNVFLNVASSMLSRDNLVDNGEITVKATAFDGKNSDGLTYTLPLLRISTLDTTAEHGAINSGKKTIPLKIPEDIFTDTGGLKLKFSPTIIGGIKGSFEYMKNYPYPCWEQRLSKAVMAMHFKRLRKYLTDMSWMEAEDGTIIKQVMDSAASYQAPNGGMSYFVPTNDRADPYLSAYTALAFSWLKKHGHRVDMNVEMKLLQYLKAFLQRDTEIKSHYTKSMTLGIRSVALIALAKNDQATLSDLDRFTPYVGEMSLLGKSHYLMAGSKLKADKEKMNTAIMSMLSMANITSGKYILQEEFSDNDSRILASLNRENCMALSAFTELSDNPLLKEIPTKLARSIIQTRGRRDRWENTQENVFCLNALADYAEKYESQGIEASVIATVDNSVLGTVTFDKFLNVPLVLKSGYAEDDPGREKELTLTHEGKGNIYYQASLQYVKKPETGDGVNSGIEVMREYFVERDGKFVELKAPMRVKRGELVRVNLFISLPAARNFVVVNDPVPGGLEPVNRDIATSSQVDADKGGFTLPKSSWFFRNDDWIGFDSVFYSFYHKELRHDVVRYYSDYLPAGNYYLSYTAQAVSDGEFHIQPLHVHEMYDEDVYGKGVMERLNVSEE